jgi:hypothetical protein
MALGANIYLNDNSVAAPRCTSADLRAKDILKFMVQVAADTSIYTTSSICQLWQATLEMPIREVGLTAAWKAARGDNVDGLHSLAGRRPVPNPLPSRLRRLSD